MASQCLEPHFVLFPLMAQGHMIPMVDLAKLLAQRGAIVTLVTTPHNAARYDGDLSRATDSGLRIRVAQLQFPCEEAGLPKGFENLDLFPPTSDAMIRFFKATYLLCDASEKLLEDLSPRPSCIVSDMCLPWTMQVAKKHHIPRIAFSSLSFFFFSCMRSLVINRDHINSLSDSEYVTFSDLPDPIELQKSQIPQTLDEEMLKFSHEMREVDRLSYGVIINTFAEMEPKYAEEYKKVRESDKVWCIGPVSLCNKEKLDKAQRGNNASIDEYECINWLDKQQPCSVIHVSLGSLCNLLTPQLIELGLGLEASNKPFIWVIRQGNMTRELEKWLLEYGFEERMKGRGLVIRGWAPQVLILSHRSIGGFLTHCGWNSTIEGISAGVPMITWPLFADQIFNEKLITQILRIGISVGVDTIMAWGEEEKRGVLVKKENVKEAIDSLMDGDDRNERRERCKKLAEAANRAVEEGGSSHHNLTLLIEDFIHHQAGCDNGTC